MCGTYSRVEGADGTAPPVNDGDEGVDAEGPAEDISYGVPPLTSVEALRRHISELSPTIGSRASTVLRALDWVLDAAASPFEAMCSLQLVAPMSMGGYGMPPMLLNPSIGLDGNVTRRGRGWAHPDMYWARARLVVELDGARFHTGRRRRDIDGRRQEALERRGARVLRLPYDRFASVDRFDAFARELADVLCVRLRVRDRDGFAEARGRLRRSLFEPGL